MVDIFDEDGQPWNFCPRGLAKQAVRRLQDEFGYSLKIGFEVEFAVNNLEMVAVENNCYSNSNSLNAYAKILEEVMDDLALLDVEVLVAHKETGPG